MFTDIERKQTEKRVYPNHKPKIPLLHMNYPFISIHQFIRISFYLKIKNKTICVCLHSNVTNCRIVVLEKIFKQFPYIILS